MFLSDFENRTTHNGIHYSRYIASWNKVGGKDYGSLFKSWLRDTQKLTEDEIQNIYQMATNGKMELEASAKVYISKYVDSLKKEAMKFNVTRNE